MFIHATPNFENIDLFKLVSKILENTGYTTRGLINNILFRENAAGADQAQDTVGGITSSLIGFPEQKHGKYELKDCEHISDGYHQVDALEIYMQWLQL